MQEYKTHLVKRAILKPIQRKTELQVRENKLQQEPLLTPGSSYAWRWLSLE